MELHPASEDLNGKSIINHDVRMRSTPVYSITDDRLKPLMNELGSHLMLLDAIELEIALNTPGDRPGNVEELLNLRDSIEERLLQVEMEIRATTPELI